jgi:hypothetical protein
LAELLGHWLLAFKYTHPGGKVLDDMLPQQYVNTRTGRRIADRLIWTGHGRLTKPRRDLASIAVEFVSGGRHSRQGDYVEKRGEYMEAGIAEYWIIDRFQRTLTVIYNRPDGVEERAVLQNETYESPILPGFVLPLAQLLEAADQREGVE